AAVLLTAGAAEAAFRVMVSAPNAPDARFDVSVSRLELVQVDVQLDATAAVPGATTLQALLYDDRTCAALPAAPSEPAAFRDDQRAGAMGAVRFSRLLPRAYAVVG